MSAKLIGDPFFSLVAMIPDAYFHAVGALRAGCSFECLYSARALAHVLPIWACVSVYFAHAQVAEAMTCGFRWWWLSFEFA